MHRQGIPIPGKWNPESKTVLDFLTLGKTVPSVFRLCRRRLEGKIKQFNTGGKCNKRHISYQPELTKERLYAWRNWRKIRNYKLRVGADKVDWLDSIFSVLLPYIIQCLPEELWHGHSLRTFGLLAVWQSIVLFMALNPVHLPAHRLPSLGGKVEK